MPETCKYPPCRCQDTQHGGYCGELCEWFHARLTRAAANVGESEEGGRTDLNRLTADDRSLMLLKVSGSRLKCGCGHARCTR